MDDAKAGKVKRVDVQGRTLQITPVDGNKYSIISPGDIWMVGDLMKYGVQVTGKTEDEPNLLVSALYYLGPTLLIIGFWFFMMRQMQGGGKGGAFSFGKSKALNLASLGVIHKLGIRDLILRARFIKLLKYSE